MAGTMGGAGTGLWLLPRGIWLLGPCSRAGRGGSPAGVGSAAREGPAPPLLGPRGFGGKAWIPGSRKGQQGQQVACPSLEPSLISLKVLRGSSEVLSSFHGRGAITHFAHDISLMAVLLPSPVGAEIPSPRIYLQGRMLEQ